MAEARWFRVTLIGSRTGTWSGEQWQTGFSLAGWDDAGGWINPVINSPLGQLTVSASAAQGSWANGSVVYGWEGSGPSGNGNQLQQQVIAVAAYEFMHDTMRTLMTSDSQLDAIKLSAYDSTGHVINGASVFTLTTPVTGTVSPSGQHPPEVAVALSLRTGGRGPRNRGRMYLPLNSATSSSGLVASTVISAVTTGGQTLGNSIIDGVAPLALAIVHRASNEGSTVTHVGVGNHFDAQRRRQTALPETYSSSPITFP